MKRERPRLSKGDYVFACETGRVDPDRAWAIGWVTHIYEHEEGDQVAFVVGSKDGKKTSDWVYRYARKITVSRGRWLLKLLRPKKPSIGDQIRAFLREERAKETTCSHTLISP